GAEVEERRQQCGGRQTCRHGGELVLGERAGRDQDDDEGARLRRDVSRERQCRVLSDSAASHVRRDATTSSTRAQYRSNEWSSAPALTPAASCVCSIAIRSIAAATEAGSGSQRIPSTPSCTAAGRPPTRVAITGRPYPNEGCTTPDRRAERESRR